MKHQPMEVRHRDELDWETIRWLGGRPIYDDRFNLAERRPLSAERTDQ